tara:strand:+ start:111 stop:266 length:156 start_codon:yes stop_codon:yes gene_type:complete
VSDEYLVAIEKTVMGAAYLWIVISSDVSDFWDAFLEKVRKLGESGKWVALV